MSKAIWSKFFWSDWETDPGLKLCSLAAQGLWMRMLCIAAKEGGYLTVNGIRLTEEQISDVIGRTYAECEPLFDELETYGVFSRTRSGVIYCRKMVKSTKKAEIARENGKKGGNPSLGKQKEIQESDKAILSPNGNNQEPEANSHKISSDDDILDSLFGGSPAPVPALVPPPPPPPVPAKPVSRFEEFWAEYPKKVGDKKKAREKYEKAVRSYGHDVIMQSLNDHVYLWSLRDRGCRYFIPETPHATTWLNQERFTNDIKPEIQNAESALSGGDRTARLDRNSRQESLASSLAGAAAVINRRRG